VARRELGGGELAGTPEADEGRHVLGARTPPPLLAAADQQRRRAARLRAHPERRRPQRAVELVAAERRGSRPPARRRRPAPCPPPAPRRTAPARPRSRQSGGDLGDRLQVPSSLLASISATSRVSSSRAAATAAGSTTPSPPGATRVTRIPAASRNPAPARIDECSSAETTIDPRKPARRATVASTVLFASVPEAVKTISPERAPRSAATSSRAASTASRAARPQRWIDDGLPCRSPSHGSIASRTRGSTGVVALWSQ
jgi:hypothetical protein